MRLIDADELKKRLKEYCIDGDKKAKEWYEIMGIDDCVDKAPTVDAVEVVRCKDCKFGVYEKGRGIYHIRCEILEFLFQDDDYCNYGERREE